MSAIRSASAADLSLRGWDLYGLTFSEVKDIAAWEESDAPLLAIDRGRYVSPRFDIIVMPQVGDEVSYAFNGDYYPDGTIVKISKTLKVIETSTGNRFYRRRESGTWLLNGTWSLIPGHVSRLNPEF